MLIENHYLIECNLQSDPDTTALPDSSHDLWEHAPGLCDILSCNTSPRHFPATYHILVEWMYNLGIIQ